MATGLRKVTNQAPFWVYPIKFYFSAEPRTVARTADGIFVGPFEQGEIGRTLFEPACRMGPRACVESTGIDGIGANDRRTGARSRTEAILRSG